MGGRSASHIWELPVAEPQRDYRIWRDGADWRWELVSVHDDKVIASGIAQNSSAARGAVLGYRTKGQMPVYFFHLSGRGRDTEGQEFPDDEAASKEAAAVARDLSQNRHVVTDDRVVVTNADGVVVHEEPLFQR